MRCSIVWGVQTVFLAFMITLFAPSSYAQNTSSVSGPKVKEGERSVEYRFAFVPGEDGGEDRFGHRLAYAHAFNTRQKLNVFARATDRGGPDGLKLDDIQAEWSFELSDEDAEFWATGVRIDFRFGNGDRAERLGLNWTNEFTLSDRIKARFMALSAVELGNTATNGVLLSVRGQLAYDLGDGMSVAVQSYDSLGTTEDFGFANRSQQLGLVLNGKMEGGWTWTVGNLFGMNDETPDNDFRVWVGRSF